MIDVEQICLREIPKLILSYQVSLSQWNKFSGQKSILVNLRENPENEETFDEDTARDWKTVQFKSFKLKVLEINKDSRGYSNKRLPETLSHLNSYYLI